MTDLALADLPDRARDRLRRLAGDPKIKLREIPGILADGFEIHLGPPDVVLALARPIRAEAEARRARLNGLGLAGGGKHIHCDLWSPAFRRRGRAGGH